MKKEFAGVAGFPLKTKNLGQILKNYFYRKMLSGHFKTIWRCFEGKMGMWRRLEVRKCETMNSLGPPPLNCCKFYIEANFTPFLLIMTS